MTISSKDVLTVAHLSRLTLDEDAVARMTSELDQILGYVQKLDELDTIDVPPTAQVTVDAAPLRLDEVRPGVAKADALAAAARFDDVGFLVPGFVDES